MLINDTLISWQQHRRGEIPHTHFEEIFNPQQQGNPQAWSSLFLKVNEFYTVICIAILNNPVNLFLIIKNIQEKKFCLVTMQNLFFPQKKEEYFSQEKS